jgi:small-conductance mechanosensitive channel
VEKTNGQFMVNCLLLEINFGRFKQILANATDNNLDTDSTFIDEVIEKKDDLIDTILKQRSVNFSNLNSKRQAELSIKQQQLQRSQIRQQFKKVITVNVKNRMSHKPKPLQNEVAEICFKGMCHKFNDVLTTNDEVFEELQKWLDLFLDILGE